MKNHRSTLTGHGEAWQAKCSCGWRSGIATRSDADDLRIAHDAHAERAHAGLRRQPTNNEVLAWFVAQAENTANTPEEREQWHRLAAELQPRVQGQTVHDQPLWEE